MFYYTLRHRHLQIIELYKSTPNPNQSSETKFCCPSQMQKRRVPEIILCIHHSSQVISIISTVSVWSNLNCQYLMSNAICQHKKRTGESESGSQVLSSQFYILTHYTTTPPSLLVLAEQCPFTIHNIYLVFSSPEFKWKVLNSSFTFCNIYSIPMEKNWFLFREVFM